MNRKTIEVFLDTALPNYDKLQIVADDASFRRYFRVWQKSVSYIVMDAPPEQENIELFFQIATAFAQAGIYVPEIIDTDFDDGYLLLSDFGEENLQVLLTVFPDKWLSVCLEKLLMIQKQGGQHLLELPEYDELFLLKELSFFPEWFITELLQDKLSQNEESMLHKLNQKLIDSASCQPKVWVHRDYHCRNLMKVGEQQIGVIGFQGALLGPITYDLVSILKDCYVRHAKSTVNAYLKDYYIELISHEMYFQDFKQFERAFDLMGLQRHLKVLGVFSRLSLRDGKHHYLNELPLVFDYVLEVLKKYPELNGWLPLFARLGLVLEGKVLR